MLDNLFVLGLVICAVVGMYYAFRKPSVSTATNSIVNHRDKRAYQRPESVKRDIPDVAKLHEHDKKVKIEPPKEEPTALFDFELLQNPEEDVIKTIRSKVSNIRKPHPLLLALCRKTSEPKELYDTIRKDPELVAKVINVANSPAFGLSQAITNLNHAIVFLGVVQVKSIATHFALQESVQFTNSQQKRAYSRIWSAGFLASSIVLELAKAMNFEIGAELSTRCQLAYLGDLAILVADDKAAKWYLESEDTLVRTQKIQEDLGTNQAVIAQILAKQWNLPSVIVNSLANGLLPMVNKLEDFTDDREKLQELLLCYISCRLADIIAFNKDKHILDADKFSWHATARTEFYYTEDQLNAAGMHKIQETMATPTFKRKIHQFINELK